MPCHRDPALGEMYALVRSQRLLESRLRALAHQVSDANLQQMPDFQLRVEVLRRLDYIAADNTVQLKVSLEYTAAADNIAQLTAWGEMPCCLQTACNSRYGWGYCCRQHPVSEGQAWVC